MQCDCVLEDGKITSECRFHRARSQEQHNEAIERVAQMVMFTTNDERLVDKVRGLKVKVEG